jgi:Cu/Ag efflux protein CusF
MNRSFAASVRAAASCLLLTTPHSAFGAVALPAGSAAYLAPLHPVQVQTGETQKVFPAVGVVTGKNPNGSLTINHQNIEGLMPAMEMAFNVRPRSLGSAVRAGDKIEFSVEGKTYTIVALKVVGHEK